MFTDSRLSSSRLAAALAIVAVVALFTAPQAVQAIHIVASTAWTAAIAEAAGASSVTVLASFELRHPPERDFRPSDITAALAADGLAWAGYESFMRQLIRAGNIPESKVFHITTQNTPDHLVHETRRLAALWGTEKQQTEWEQSFVPLARDVKNAASLANVATKRVIVTEHLAAFVAWLGYDIIDTFGFEDMTPVRLHQLSLLQPDIVIDVWHNPTAEAVAVATNAPYVTLINFPGRAGTRTLADVFTYNAAALGLPLK